MSNHYSDAGDIRLGDQRVKGRDSKDSEVSQTRCLSPEQIESARVWGLKVSMQMQKGNQTAALDIVRRGMAAMHGNVQDGILDTPLNEIGIDDLILNVLDRKFDALTVGALLEIDHAKLLAIPNFGPMRTVSVFAALARFGITRALELERAARK